MGVPSFFRWLSRKYPELVTVAQEEKAKDSKGNNVRVDCTKSNPNWQEFDNLYLDMNGIIHPCTHPDDGPAPTTEEEMFVLIFKYIDRIFAIVRPRKLLYMAIDGVAPRAKMNQQRSRRFRASKETMEKQILIDEVRSRLEKEGKLVPPLKSLDAQFDTNCITPGTPFMARLADALRWYIHQRLTTDPAWTNLQVILSDANSPGEGEHKIMEYIRRQRANPNHNPNTSHCMCGADADLIMLGLATHEVNFNIIREEFKPNGASPCELCGQYGHELMECQGLPVKEKGSAPPIKNKNIRVKQEKKFIFIRLPVLREYLERELAMPNISIPYDFERVIDDWVFLCFFVGNDFLPHLPSLEIREGAITRLVYLYKEMVHKMKGYLTHNGEVFIDRVQMIMKGLGKAEDVIFKRRQEQEDSCHSNSKSRGSRAKGNGKNNVRGGKRDPLNGNDHLPQCNWEPKTMAKNGSVETEGTEIESEDDDESNEPETNLFVDEIKLHEEGWKERYYRAKFDVGLDNVQFRRALIRAYMEGLCWVLSYYYQGCASWDWYYPYHYAPFASDFESMGKFKPDFSKKTTPFKPLEQLMSVFPAASKQHLPKSWQALMTDEKSPIIKFYPTDFRIDLNWKKHLWQGVALLPFVDEKLLLETLKGVYSNLTEEEQARNSSGPDHMFISKEHPAFKTFHDRLYGKNDSVVSVVLDSKLTNGLSGTIEKDEGSVAIGQTFISPIKHDACPNLKANEALMVVFKNPVYPDGHTFQAIKLQKAKLLPRVLKDQKVVVKSVGGYGGREHRNGTPRFSSSSYNNRAVGPQGAKANGAPPVTTGVARGGASFGGRGRGGNSAGNRGGRAPVVKAVVKPKPIVVTNKWALLEDLDD